MNELERKLIAMWCSRIYFRITKVAAHLRDPALDVNREIETLGLIASDAQVLRYVLDPLETAKLET